LGDVPDLAFKDLCFDVTAGGRAAEVVSFWSITLGQARLVRPMELRQHRSAAAIAGTTTTGAS
jgi:hypothetical protein